jgi:predicted O-methyltransferase YrrM
VETEKRWQSQPSKAAKALIAQGFTTNLWPGEHYRLLNALVRQRKASLVVEVGTFWGMGTLAIKEALPPGGKIVTYDILSWKAFAETLLCDQDFDEGQVVQVVGDLQNDDFFASQMEIFKKADIIFMDAAKDGVMERVFLRNFTKCKYEKPPLLIIDDIRLWNMQDIWQEISQPKLDISCFGHYTGTGIVELVSN